MVIYKTKGNQDIEELYKPDAKKKDIKNVLVQVYLESTFHFNTPFKPLPNMNGEQGIKMKTLILPTTPNATL